MGISSSSLGLLFLSLPCSSVFSSFLSLLLAPNKGVGTTSKPNLVGVGAGGVVGREPEGMGDGVEEEEEEDFDEAGVWKLTLKLKFFAAGGGICRVSK